MNCWSLQWNPKYHPWKLTLSFHHESYYDPYFNPFSKGGSQHQVTRYVKESWGKSLARKSSKPENPKSNFGNLSAMENTMTQKNGLTHFSWKFWRRSGGKAGWRGKNNSWGKIQFGRQADIVWKTQCPKFSTCISCFFCGKHIAQLFSAIRCLCSKDDTFRYFSEIIDHLCITAQVCWPHSICRWYL